jgi:septum formation protein
LPFVTAAPNVDETPATGELSHELAARLARAKACAVRPAYPSALIIGCDQTAAVDGIMLDKPGEHERAVRQLQLMRGKTVSFFTALCLLDAGTARIQREIVTDIVHMRRYSDAEIERYLHAERPYDCTGSARIEGLGIALVEKLESEDPAALIGLPLLKLCAMLRDEGVHLP